ncbi:hypothetical protein Dsin_005271 [Dipteronia sinensis]|uniref:Protein FAR1-RELATED SEQUENCE n=1 Tax=Dipteronia sinensis TaxID=43782 RepID=A0AAE0AXK6_9ROSI|nr:hypothetical protein Dsin_005271 [Dipteronia sinensis]
MTDGDEAMRQAIDEVFPNCQHRICGWHVAKNACAHINGPKKSSTIISFIFDHIDEDKFDECWKEMIKQHGLEDNVWVNMIKPFSNSDKEMKTDSKPSTNSDKWETMVRTIEKSERALYAVDGSIFRHPALDQIKNRHFTGKYVAGAYNIGMEDVFKLFKDYMKKFQPEGDWDVVDLSNAKYLLKD